MTERIQSILSDEESMQQIKELAAMLGVSSEDAAEKKAPSVFQGLGTGFDPSMLTAFSSAFSDEDKYCGLLSALKPLLSEERQHKAEQAIKILRLYNAYNTLKNSGILDKLGLP